MTNIESPAGEGHAILRTRALAAFLDVSLALLPSLLVVGVIATNVLRSGGSLLRGFGAGFGVGVLALALLALGQCLLVGFTGQSYGKLAAKLRIVRAADGGRPTFVRGAVVRTLLFGAIWIGCPPLILLDLGVGLVRRDGRCLHDLVAGTRVVSA